MIGTGADGYMKVGANRIGKCRNVRLSIAKTALQDTKLNQYDETYISGKRNTTGTATLFYNPSDTVAAGFLNSIFANSTSASQAIEIVLNRPKQKSMTVSALLTEVGVSVAFGEAQVCEVTFQVSGGVTGVF